MSIIQSKCILEHHGIIGDCNVNPGLTTGGLVKISDFCQINMSEIINRILVEKNSTIGAGSLVMKNISKNKLVAGRPAK